MKSNNTFILTLVLTLLTTAPSFHTTNAQDCNPSDPLPGQDPPPGTCDPTGSDCCVAGESYTTCTCSPQVTDTTSAIMTVNDFEQGGDGGGASSCDQSFHTNDELVVALSTGWFDSGSRCGHDIVISANGLTTTAKVVDECDSRHGCDEEHAYQKPCRFNVVDASSGVWDALGLSSSDGETTITWSDA